MYILTGVLGLFGLTLIVLLVVSRFTEKAKPQPNRTGTPNTDGPVGWGPFGFLFPKSWVYVWWGYLAMVVLSAFVFPEIFPEVLPSGGSATAEIILFIGPFIHCILMPFLWVHKHREDKKWIENHLNEDVVVTTALDPEDSARSRGQRSIQRRRRRSSRSSLRAARAARSFSSS